MGVVGLDCKTQHGCCSPLFRAVDVTSAFAGSRIPVPWFPRLFESAKLGFLGVSYLLESCQESWGTRLAPTQWVTAARMPLLTTPRLPVGWLRGALVISRQM